MKKDKRTNGTAKNGTQASSESSKRKEKKPINKKKLLITLVCIFVLSVLIFGAVMGIILGIRNARAAVVFKGVRISEGEASFLLAKYKRDFLIKHFGYDGEEFWNQKYDEKTTYGDLLRQESETYLREIAIRNYLFDSVSGIEFTALDDISVKRAVNDVLDYRSENDEQKFNETAKAYGFTFDDFASAAVLLYKAEVVQSRIYGSDGSGIRNSVADCEEYFKNYSHVKLFFIRTEDKFEIDSDGNRVTDENGNDKRVPLTESEKRERADLIADIMAKIDAYNNKTDQAQMTPTHFTALLNQHGEGDPSRNETGYYFSAYSEFSSEFVSNPDGTVNEKRLQIVKTALEGENGYYIRDFDGGVCFIYKYDNVSGAYANSSDMCFSDFYTLCAQDTFSRTVSALYDGVKIKEKVYAIDVVAIPGDNPFVPRFE